MKEQDLSPLERLVHAGRNWLAGNAVPFLSTFGFGLLAYAFAFLNKLPNLDDVLYLFGKGAMADSGRWGIALLRFLIPDFSMPWLHGIFSLLLLAVSVCLIVRLFKIQRPLYQALLAGLIVCFPSQIGTFCYMFTASCYAVAFLLSVLCVCALQKRLWKGFVLSVLCLVLVLSIYQAYLALISGLMLLLLISELLSAGSENIARKVLKEGLLDLAVLAAGCLLYLLSVVISLRLLGLELNDYSVEAHVNGPGFPQGIFFAYRMFVYNLSSRYNMLIVSKPSRLLHLLALAAGLCGIAYCQIRAKCPMNTLLLLLCLLLLPLSICCMYIVVYWNDVHTLVLYGYALLYLLVILGLEQIPRPLLLPARDLICILLSVILGINICYANRSFLKLHLAYENAYSLSTTLLTQVRMLPDYDESMKLAVWPSIGAYLSFAPEFGPEDESTHDIRGTHSQLLTGETEEAFFRRYLGARTEFLDWWETRALAGTDEASAMPLYPAPGSIRIFGDIVFIKMGPSPIDSDTPYEYPTIPAG